MQDAHNHPLLPLEMSSVLALVLSHIFRDSLLSARLTSASAGCSCVRWGRGTVEIVALERR